MQVRADLAASRSRQLAEHGRALRPRGHLVGDEVAGPDGELVEEGLQRGQPRGVSDAQLPPALLRPLVVGLGVDPHQ